jgi:hypothetical protein
MWNTLLYHIKIFFLNPEHILPNFFCKIRFQNLSQWKKKTYKW